MLYDIVTTITIIYENLNVHIVKYKNCIQYKKQRKFRKLKQS